MNYLGHIYLSGNDTRLMCSNIFGDFVKGNKNDFADWILEGIQLHREIDYFTDNHQAVKEILPLLRTALPKVAPIAIDIYFDHLLAQNWTTHHPQDFESYTSRVFIDFEQLKLEFPLQFQTFIGYFISRKWITYYPYYDGLERLSQGVSTKLSFPNTLSTAPQIFIEHKELINTTFETFIEDARNTFLKEELRILS